MQLDLIIDNLSNPALLFFFLGIAAVQLKSDLKIPENSSKFIALYLLFAIGFKGGQELSHSTWNAEIYNSILLGVFLSFLIPVYTYLLLKKKMGPYNAAAIAAAYGSVSAVTFVTSISFLEMHSISFGGHMVAVMAMMEAPAIVAGIMILNISKGKDKPKINVSQVIKHSFTNGSVLLICGSLIIGLLATDQQAAGIEPFTTDIFKGFLAIFLLDMGIVCGKKLSSFLDNGWSPFLFAFIAPLINGLAIAVLSGFWISDPGNRFLLTILAASASYIAVPAAMKLAIPQANPGIYIPMALGITFPINITIGMPFYWLVITSF